ncbi:hypothetical protein [Micromonospora sp. NBC_01796]|uniref:hypothetical protein n=1 Tax=Micromonospora sp. NBC_01796 TaxID=2975987 RepID=UPI002DD8FBFA|nr:hypothetical protein [Micromonospora sp. NBC_01796]WSA86408.1 hypothetical protein OIE47_01950 [Micromonospora sp. NBC_01796]
MPSEESESTTTSTPKRPTTVIPKTTSGKTADPDGSTANGGGASVPYKTFVIGMSGRTRRRPRA